jgi:hypothetical protein
VSLTAVTSGIEHDRISRVAQDPYGSEHVHTYERFRRHTGPGSGTTFLWYPDGNGDREIDRVVSMSLLHREVPLGGETVGAAAAAHTEVDRVRDP